MDDRRLGVGLCVILGGVVTVAGCVTMGRPLPETYARGTVEASATGRADVPLVPVPPPPLARSIPLDPSPKVIPLPDEVRPAEKKASITLVSGHTKSTASSGITSPVAVAEAASPPRPAPGVALPTVRQLFQNAQAKYAGMDSYIVRLTRREMVKEKTNPDEVILFKFRKQPWSLYFKWLSKDGLGREVVYVNGQHESKIHTLLAAGDIPFVPAGKRMALAPDNVLVKSSTRHPITEAGIGACVDRIGTTLAALDKGDRRAGTLQVLGPVKRAEFEQPIYAIEHVLPAGADLSLPKGGRRTYYIHPEIQLPMLIVARDERGREVEYYLYDRLQAGVKLDADDFNPDKLWAKQTTARSTGR